VDTATIGHLHLYLFGYDEWRHSRQYHADGQCHRDSEFGPESDLAPSGNNIPPPRRFHLDSRRGSLWRLPITTTHVAGSIYSLSISNVSMYNTGDTNKPLTTTGFYKSAANNYPATFTLSGLQPTLKVTLYAIYAWNGAGKGGNVFFGAPMLKSPTPWILAIMFRP